MLCCNTFQAIAAARAKYIYIYILISKIDITVNVLTEVRC